MLLMLSIQLSRTYLPTMSALKFSSPHSSLPSTFPTTPNVPPSTGDNASSTSSTRRIFEFRHPSDPNVRLKNLGKGVSIYWSHCPHVDVLTSILPLPPTYLPSSPLPLRQTSSSRCCSHPSQPRDLHLLLLPLTSRHILCLRKPTRRGEGKSAIR